MFMTKKGISVWISWVLIIGFTVVLGTFFFSFMKGFTEESVEELIDRNEQVQVCDETSLRVDSFCQNTQTLNINVSNNGNLRIEELLFRMFDIYGMPQAVYKNVTINTEKTASLVIVKQGVIDQVEVIPVAHEKSNRFICQNRKVTEEDIKFC